MSDQYDNSGNSSNSDHAEFEQAEDLHRIQYQIPSKILTLKDSTNHSIIELLHHAKTAYSMLMDSTYSLQWKSKALLIAGLLYFLLPIDLTPDFIPFIGYIDDAAVLSAIIKSLAAEIKMYRDIKGL